MRSLFAVACAWAAFLAATTHAADITLHRDRVWPNGALLISGRIEPGDDRRLAVEYERNPREIVLFDSIGGDVFTAIRIGRFLRERNLAVFSPAAGSVCASACVLAIIGGVARAHTGRIAIHRPRFDDQYFANLGVNEARAAYDRMAAAVRAYLADMGAPEELFRAMLAVPSDQARWLTDDEVVAFGIFGVDPAWSEWNRARRATGR